jgi:type IV pilus assembly protein PilM
MASFLRRLILDVGANEIRVAEVVADKSGAPVFSQLRSLGLGVDPTKPAEFFPALLQGVETLVKGAGLKPGPATICLGGPSVFTRVIKVPVSDPTQVRQMVGFEAQQAIPAIEEACWDFQIFPASEGATGELEALIVAMKRDSVDEVMAAASKAGLRTDMVELAPTALINAFRYNYPEMTTCTLLLEIGARSTNIVIVEGKKMFCRVVPLGGATVTQAIAADLQESFAGAEVLKKAKGFVHPGGSYEDPVDEQTARMSKLARGVMTRLHTEVERSVTFYRSQQVGSRPAQVLLAGGGACLGLTEMFFREKLKVPVEFFQPFRRAALGAGVAPAELAKTFPSWAILVGAALRSLPDSPCRINILGSAQRAAVAKTKDRPAIIAAGVGVGLLLFLPGLHGFWQSGRIQGLLSPQTAEVDEAEAALAKVDAEQKKGVEILGLADKALGLEAERMRWPILLAELRAKSLPGMWVTQIALADGGAVSEGEAGAGAKSGAPKIAVPVLELGGFFETKSEEADSKVVEDFRVALEQGGVLQKVETTQRDTPERSADGKTEQVALKFRMRAEWPVGGVIKVEAAKKPEAK